MPAFHPFPQIIDAAKKLRAAQEAFLSAPLIAWSNKEHARKQGIRNFWKPLKHAFGHDPLAMQQLRDAFAIGYRADSLRSEVDVGQLETERGKTPPRSPLNHSIETAGARGQSPAMDEIGTAVIASMRQAGAVLNPKVCHMELRRAERAEDSQLNTARGKAPISPTQIPTERGGYFESIDRTTALNVVPNRTHTLAATANHRQRPPMAIGQEGRRPTSHTTLHRSR